MSTHPFSKRLLFSFHEKVKKIIKETNVSLIKPLLNLRSLYLASCAYFAFSLVHKQLPAVFKSPPFFSDFSSYALLNATDVRITSI